MQKTRSMKDLNKSDILREHKYVVKKARRGNLSAPRKFFDRQRFLFQFWIEAERCQRERFLFYAVVDCVSAAIEYAFAGADEKTEGHAHQASEQHRVDVLFSADFVSEILSVFHAAVRAASGDCYRDTNNHAGTNR